jgi:DNA adenine methylase
MTNPKTEKVVLKSPFRYPGAKTRIVHGLMRWIVPGMARSEVYVEPFVGGGSVLLSVAEIFPDCQLVVNDLDKSVYSFWKCMTDTKLTMALVRKIKNTTPTVKEHDKQQERLDSKNIVKSAFAGLFCNRTSFSGILTSGSIGGEQQKSKWTVGCRYNAGLLCEGVKAIHRAIGHRLSVFNEDFSVVMRNQDRSGVLVYCDCPYYSKGNILYRHGMSPEDHKRLRDSLKALQHAKFVASYDKVKEVQELYAGFEVSEIKVRYSIEGENRKSWNGKSELVFFSKGVGPSGTMERMPVNPSTGQAPNAVVMTVKHRVLSMVLEAFQELQKISSDGPLAEMKRDSLVAVLRRAKKMGIPQPVYADGSWQFIDGMEWESKFTTLEGAGG